MTTAALPTPPPATRLPSGRYGLPELIRSEWIKLRTVRSTVWSSILIVVLGVGLGLVAAAETRAHWATQAHPGFDPTRLSLVGVNGAQLVIGVLGALVITGEYGTGTIRATFSAIPRRPMALLAKIGVFAVAALAVSEVVGFASFFLGQAMLTAPATHATLSTPGALRAVIGSGLYLCVIGLISLGLGLIIRHTAGAIGALVGILLIFPIIVTALPQSLINALQRYEPLQIGRIMITVFTVQQRARLDKLSSVHKTLATGRHLVIHAGGIPSFSPWAGFGILCGYGVAILAVGMVLLVRRDA